MERLSNLISKNVLSLEEGECVGYVLNVSFDIDRLEITGLLICDEESELVKFLDIKNVLYNNDFIVVKNTDVLSFGENIDCVNPISKGVVSEKGEKLGRVCDIEINNKKIVKLITEKGEINPKNIINLGAKILIFSEKNKKRKKYNYFPKIKTENNVKVGIFENKNTIENNNQIPFKSTLSPQKLIGRIILSDIYGFNNELIAKKNQIITDKIIKIAKKHNKINYLLFNSK